MKKLLALCVFFPVFLSGQLKTNQLPESDVATLREKIYDKIAPDYKDGRWERRSFNYAHTSAQFISGKINSGQIYSDWPQWELYLNAIMQKVMPLELQEDSTIHAYFVADGHFNASMTAAGTMFVNVGAIAQITDEATLAALMAHELSHYYLQHNLQKFIKSEEGDFKVGLYDTKNYSRFSIKHEYQADSLATIWMLASGYDLEGILKLMDILADFQAKRIAQLEDKWELEETSHPISEKRRQRIESQVADFIQGDDKSQFLISRALYQKLRAQAQHETLKNLLATFSYDDCIEKAFKYHLYDPNNSDYVYFLMEAIRRKCYLDPTVWKENFITYRYYTSSDVASFKVKKPMEEHIFTKFDPKLLGINTDEESSIPTMFYWQDDAPKFMTNEQAFLFYYRVGLALNNNEVILSNALSVTHDIDERNRLLKVYLSKDGIRYEDYAHALLNDGIWSALRSQTLTLMNDFNIIVKQGKHNIDIPASQQDSTFVNDAFVEVMNTFPKKKLMKMSDLRYSSLEEYRLLSEMELFSFIRTVSNTNKTELHILEPAYWETFRKYGVNEIEFVNFAYYEFRSNETSKEAYEEVLGYSYASLFEQVKRTRNLRVFVGSLRQKENCLMKYRFVAEYDLDSKSTGSVELKRALRSHLVHKEEKESKADGRYRAYFN